MVCTYNFHLNFKQFLSYRYFGREEKLLPITELSSRTVYAQSLISGCIYIEPNLIIIFSFKTVGLRRFHCMEELQISPYRLFKIGSKFRDVTLKISHWNWVNKKSRVCVDVRHNDRIDDVIFFLLLELFVLVMIFGSLKASPHLD